MGTANTHHLSAEEDSLIGLLQCPSCQSKSLSQSATIQELLCADCGQSFPMLAFGKMQIPFLFSYTDIATYDWCARINGFNKKISEDIALITQQVKHKTHSKLTRERLKLLLNAKKSLRDQITQHMQCFQSFESQAGLISQTEIDKNQGLDSYINNIFRDWCWQNGENEQLLNAVKSVLDDSYDAGISLTLGAGAGRLSYDFHQAFNSDHSVLLDINPMLLGHAGKIINGEKVALYEFPVAPKSLADHAVMHELQHSGLLAADEFSYILADASNAPLQEKSFDTILTPWLIDIIPIDFRDFVPHVNRLLKTGGLWVNSGSLAFFHQSFQSNYSEEEIIDILKKFGFTDIQVNRSNVNYLCSPYSAHGRIENIFSFSAVKKFDTVEAKKHNYLPAWVENVNQPIPEQTHLLASSSKYLLQAQVLSAIDGQRSIFEIGCLLAKQYEMPEADAIAAVRKILIDNI